MRNNLSRTSRVTLPANTVRMRSDARTSASMKAKASTPRRQNEATENANARLPLPVALFLVGLVIPWIIPIGPLSLTVYRLVLVIMLLPCMAMWAAGKAGPIRFADIAVILFSFWASLGLALVGGVGPMLQSIGILNVETLGAYFLARRYIRTADDFRNMVHFACALVLILLPFSLYEWVTGGKPLLTTFAFIFPTVDITMMEPRWGLWRVQGPFGHSIVYGLFCGSLVALAYLVLGYGKIGLNRWMTPAAIALAAFVSMSSAPIAGMLLQFALILWNLLFRKLEHRWKILWGFVFLGYLIVEFGSNQTPVTFYISHFTFDAQTGWYRLLIWQYGSASVANYPWFGIGFGDWARLPWMISSVDNFWLVIAMRHGIPAVVLIFTSCLAVMCEVAFKKGLGERTNAYRTGYLICMVMFVLVGCTVHFWASVYAWFIFLLGCGVWMLDVDIVGATRLKGERNHQRTLGSERFAVKEIRTTSRRPDFSDGAG